MMTILGYSRGGEVDDSRTSGGMLGLNVEVGAQRFDKERGVLNYAEYIR